MNWSATGPHWIIAFGEVRNGKAFFGQGKESLLCPRNFALFVPAFSLVQSDERSAEVFLHGILHHGSAPRGLPLKSMMFVPTTWSLPTKSEKVAEFFESGTRKICIDTLKEPSYLVERAKKTVEENFSKDLKIPEIAFKLKTNPAALSREFQTQSGLSLTAYYELLQASERLFSAFPEGAELRAPSLDFSKLSRQTNSSQPAE
jgi:hypothetical protein